jgi:hypothetical protein
MIRRQVAGGSFSDTAALARQVVLGVDRLDYIKGIPLKMLAYEALLQKHSELHGKIVLVQVAHPPTRVPELELEDNREYTQMQMELNEMVGRINGQYSLLDWQPIYYINKWISQDELAALYRAADVGFFTAIREGINGICYEFGCAQAPECLGFAVGPPDAKPPRPAHRPVRADVLRRTGSTGNLERAGQRMFELPFGIAEKAHGGYPTPREGVEAELEAEREAELEAELEPGAEPEPERPRVAGGGSARSKRAGSGPPGAVKRPERSHCKWILYGVLYGRAGA